MGSLTSSPKAPSASKVVQVAQPIQQAEPQQTKNTEELAAAQREKNLLSRQRGQRGTIATSFRGFLGQSESKNERKTLLGE